MQLLVEFRLALRELDRYPQLVLFRLNYRVGALALSIGDDRNRYEFRCMTCGWSTGWFEATDDTVTKAEMSSDEPTERYGDGGGDD